MGKQACPRVAQRDKLKQRKEQRTTLDLASEQNSRGLAPVSPHLFGFTLFLHPGQSLFL
jgi:hypothetical protein